MRESIPIPSANDFCFSNFFFNSLVVSLSRSTEDDDCTTDAFFNLNRANSGFDSSSSPNTSSESPDALRRRKLLLI